MNQYYITDRKSAGGFRNLIEIIRDQMQLGIEMIQIREKDLSARELFEFTLAVLEIRDREIRSPNPTRILVNSRSDVAFAAGADGVHLPAGAPQQILSGLFVGRSCHSIQEIRSAAVANFVTFGPVFHTPGKGEALGLKALTAACQLGKPVYALGGVDWNNAESCLAAGAHGVAGIRLFQEPDL